MADNPPTVVVAQPVAIVVQPRPAPASVVATGPQGPAGPPGVDGAQVSQTPDNRLEMKPDGLYVSDDLTPDPLAYYILAKG